MNQQQFDQMQNDMLAMQAQLPNANAIATQAQAAAQAAQNATVAQAAIVAQQQIDLVAAQALAAQAVNDAANAQAAAIMAAVVPVGVVPVLPAPQVSTRTTDGSHRVRRGWYEVAQISVGTIGYAI
jgi:RES domain-containing protein